MKTKNKRSAIGKSFYVIVALYIVGFAGANIIGIFSGSFFAYKLFNSLPAAVFYILFHCLLYVTAFVSELFASRKPRDIATNVFVFLGSMAVAVLMFFFGGIFLFVGELYAAIMLGLIATRFALKMRKQCYPDDDPDVDVKPVLAAISLILFALVRMLRVEFVSNAYAVWALIPAAGIFLVVSLIALILSKDYLRTMFPSKASRALRVLGAGLCIFIFAFIFGFTAVETVNCVFDGEPTPSQFTVLDKNVSGGTHTVTQHKVKVSIEGKEFWIPIPASEYFNLDIGDAVTLDYYKGALGFAYWKYSEKADGQ